MNYVKDSEATKLHQQMIMNRRKYGDSEDEGQNSKVNYYIMKKNGNSNNNTNP